MAVQLPAQLQPISQGGGPWSRSWYEWAWRITDAVNAGGGGGGGAPTNASYVTLGTDATLTAERVLTAGAGISLTDSGPGGTITVASTVTSGAPTNAQYVTLATDGSLTAERVLTAGAGISITDGGANNPVTVACTVTSGAPTTAQYVTLATDGSLSAERVLTAGAGISIADGGANGPVTVAATAKAATSYVNFGSTAGTRLTASVVDAAVVPGSIILVNWGAVLSTDDNDPELDDITFFATPGTGSFTVTATCETPISGRCRVNYTVA